MSICLNGNLASHVQPAVNDCKETIRNLFTTKKCNPN